MMEAPFNYFLSKIGMKYWPKEVREKAREMILQGMSRSQVSIALNVPIGTLSKWVLRLGRHPITYGEDKRKEAWDIYNKGMSRPQIAG